MLPCNLFQVAMHRCLASVYMQKLGKSCSRSVERQKRNVLNNVHLTLECAEITCTGDGPSYDDSKRPIPCITALSSTAG